MGPAPSRIAVRRRLLPGPALWCALVLVGAQAGAQSPPPPPESPATVSTAAPRLVLDTEVIDLGQLVRGESAEASFALRNEGDAVLRILRAKPG